MFALLRRAWRRPVILRQVDPKAEPAVFEAIVQLRVRVWTAQMQAPLTPEDLLDRFDEVARHWAVFDGDVPVAAARLSAHDRVEDVPEAECLVECFPSPPPAPIAFLSRLV